MNSSIVSPEVLEGLSGFLKWGPSGLAGLMLVLVIVALTFREMSASRERVLTKFMYVGAVCFFLALGASFIPPPGPGGAHALHLRVEPLDQGTTHTLPMPIIDINNARLSANPPRTYSIRSEATAIIDVSDAINFVQEFRSQNNRQRQQMSTILSTTDTLLGQLRRTTQLVNDNCSGRRSSASGSARTIIRINSEVTKSILRTRAALASALAETPPVIKN